MNHIPQKLYSQISINSLYTIYNLKYSKDYKFYGESHNFWELVFVIQGMIGVTSGEYIYECEQGDLVIHRPGVFHTMWTKNNNPQQCFIISFNGDGLDYLMPDGKFKLSEDEASLITLLIKEVPTVFSGYDINEYEHLKDIALPGNVGYQLIKNYLETICLTLISKGKEARHIPSKNPKSILFAKTVAFLKKNITQNICMEDICREMFESSSNIKLIFKQFTGGGIIKYYNCLRCEYCLQLICDGLTMSGIASVMNFSSQNYFSYFFKREMGITPLEYKQTLDKI